MEESYEYVPPKTSTYVPSLYDEELPSFSLSSSTECVSEILNLKKTNSKKSKRQKKSNEDKEKQRELKAKQKQDKELEQQKKKQEREELKKQRAGDSIAPNHSIHIEFTSQLSGKSKNN